MVKKILYIAIVASILSACNQKQKYTQPKPVDQKLTLKKIYDNLQDIITILPQQQEIYTIINKYEIPFVDTLLNPVFRIESYKQTDQQAINLGVYMADLLYASIYQQQNQQKLYMGLVRKLMTLLKFDNIIAENFKLRFEQNLNNIDSLENILRTSYKQIIDQFYQHNQLDKAILSVSGFWLESFYLAAVLSAEQKIDQQDLNNITQRYFSILNSILQIFEDYKNLTNTHLILYTELKEIYAIYQQVKKPITFAQFNRLLQRVKFIRNNYTKNI